VADWSLIGGNPAPGRLFEIGLDATEFAKIAAEAQGVGTRPRAGWTPPAPTPPPPPGATTWAGPAADTFRAHLNELPRRLEMLHDSFDEAERGVRTFVGTLTWLQGQAQAALSNAAAADGDRARADAERARLDDMLRPYQLERPVVLAKAAALRARYRLEAATGLPTAAATHAQLLQADTRLAYLERTIAELTRQRAGASARLEAAHQQSADARSRGDDLRREYADARVRLTGALAAAHDLGLNPTAFQSARKWVADWGPLIADALSLAAVIMAFTPLAPFAPLVQGLSMVVSIVATLAKEHRDGWDYASLVGNCLGAAAIAFKGLAAVGTLARVAWKMDRVERFAVTATRLEHAHTAVDIATDGAHVFFDVRSLRAGVTPDKALMLATHVVGLGVDTRGGKMLEPAATRAIGRSTNRSMDVARRLEDSADSLRQGASAAGNPVVRTVLSVSGQGTHGAAGGLQMLWVPPATRYLFSSPQVRQEAVQDFAHDTLDMVAESADKIAPEGGRGQPAHASRSGGW